jgi:hypothetical protein
MVYNAYINPLLSDNQETLDDTLKKGESAIKAEILKWSGTVVVMIKTMLIQSLIEKNPVSENNSQRVKVSKVLKSDSERMNTYDSDTESTPSSKIITVSASCKNTETPFVSSDIPKNSTDNNKLESDNAHEKVNPRQSRRRKKNEDDMDLDIQRPELPQIKQTLSPIRKK